METREADTRDARVQIHALLAEHVNCGDAGDVQSMIGLYAPEATYELPNGMVLQGTEQMREVLGGASSGSTEDGWGLEYMRHHLTTAHIELTEDAEGSEGVEDAKARSDSYFLNVNNRGLDHWGRWQDTFMRQADGSWLFSSRKVMVEGSVPGSWFEIASGLG
jgi:ketosteroid isomerase-like protein